MQPMDMIQESVVTSSVPDHPEGDAVKYPHQNQEYVRTNGHADGDAVRENAAFFTFQDKWGLPMTDVYRLGVAFYREKYGKAGLQVPYTSKVKMVALTRQISNGPFRPDLVADIGMLDVIGSDRRQAWSSLGDMSKDDAMIRFVDLLDALCPLFKPYIEAHKRDREIIRNGKDTDNGDESKRDTNERPQKTDEEEENISMQLTPDATTSYQAQLTLEQELQIREALNLQTLHQFRAFCEQQLPGRPNEQKLLTEKLQEEHFRQYLKRWMEAAANAQLESPVNNADAPADDASVSDRSVKKGAGSDEEPEDVIQGSGVSDTIQAASLWTRADIKEFKESVRSEGGEGVLKIGQGETVTIRVPTHPEGNYLFWEFATDSYDIGFGLMFEWSNNANENRVTIHVSESDEDDEEFDSEGTGNDPEKGSGPGHKPTGGPPVDEIVPIFRRDSHLEVIAGSHLYPARQGVYLLKFDNSFSLWRSKSLYYRVYYTR